jgi:hypothetical protein
MENVLVNVLDRPGGTVIYEGKYKPGLKDTALLTALRATYGIGNLNDSRGFDIVDSDDGLDAGLYSYVPIPSSAAGNPSLATEYAWHVCFVTTNMHSMLVYFFFHLLSSSYSWLRCHYFSCS